MRKFWIRLLISINHLSLKILDNLSLEKTLKTTKFKSLAPTTKIEDPEIYHQALDWALRNREAEDIKNIAITGYYGSGKSSVIKSFIKHNSHRYKFLPLSLATFKDDKNSTSNSNKSIQEIEESILQQIFYKVPDSEIPNSRFSKISSNFLPEYLLASVPIIVFILILLLYFVPKFKISLGWDLSEQQIAYGLIISGVISIFLLLWRLKNLTLTKFSVKNLEVDLVEKNNQLSVLNTYIDEIIYFFKKTKYKIVIIEDIDRFETTEIFTKLREINLILNSSEITKNLHIVFIYAIKDDQFKNKKDRTKFFDFILPVIPVINLNNSIDKIIKIRDDYKLGISNKLVKELAIYIDDMRLLLNIFNEFIIYDAQIKDVSRDKLLALIIYKNLLSDDFALLAQGRGLLYSIINKKQVIIKEKIQEHENKIEELKLENRNIEETVLLNIKELRSVYVLEYLNSLKSNPNIDFQTFYYGNKKLQIEEVKRDENFDILIENKMQFVSSYYGTRKFDVQFEEIEKKVNDRQSYKEREDIINKKSKNQIAVNNRLIAERRREILDVNKSSLYEVISNSIIKDTLSEYLRESIRIRSENYDGEIAYLLKKNLPLIRSLITNGFIDEDYFMYISIFYEERLTRKDFQYIQNVKNFKKVEYDYELKNVSEIIEFLNPRNLESDFAYNRDLTNYLLTSKEHLAEKHIFFDALSNCKEPALNFITYFIKSTPLLKEFVQEITIRNHKLWDDIQSSDIGDDNLQMLYKLILRYADLKIILGLIQETSLDVAIINDENFLKRIENKEKLKKILSQSGLKLESINFLEIDKDLLDFVYSNNYYAFTKQIIVGFYKSRTIEKKDDFLKRPYTIISQDPELIGMFNYIQENLNRYINDIPLHISENDSEEEKYFLKLLNSEEITFDNKLSLIQKQKTVIVNASDVEDVNLIEILLKEEKILATWLNIDYISDRMSEGKPTKIPKQVADFLSVERVSKELQQQSLNKEGFSIENIETLIMNRIDIPDDRYAELITSFQAQDDMDLSGIDFSKTEILLKKEKLTLSQENLLQIRKNNSELVVQFLEKWKREFVLTVDDYILKLDELKSILKSSNFTATEKTRILQSQNSIKIREDQELSAIIANLIIDEKQFSAPVSVILDLIEVNLKIDRSIKLFNKISGKFSNEQIRSFLENLKNPFRKLADTTSRPSIPKDVHTTEMLEILESRGIISSKKPEGQKYRVYKPAA